MTKEKPPSNFISVDIVDKDNMRLILKSHNMIAFYDISAEDASQIAAGMLAAVEEAKDYETEEVIAK
jgi:hypothetical protein